MMRKRGSVCPVWNLTKTDLVVLAYLRQQTKGRARTLRVADLIPADASRRSVLRALPRLESAGLVRVQRASKPAYPSTYRVVEPKCPWLRELLRAGSAKDRVPRRLR